MLVRQGVDPVEPQREAKRKEKALNFSVFYDLFVELYLQANWPDTLPEAMLRIMKARASERGKDPDEISLNDWRLHDLRRAGATNLHALGIPIEVTEAVLNHICCTRAGVAGTYNR